MKRRGRPPHDDLLTPAEWQVVHAVRHGLSNRQIANRRGVSIDAVKYHVANAVAKLGLGSRAALRHWRGAPRDSAANREDDRVDTQPLAITGLGQVARSVTDIEQAQAFYRDVVQLPHLYTYGNLAFFACGDTRLMLTQAEGEAAGESVLYLRVSDIDAAYTLLQARGAEFVGAPHMIFRHDDGTEEWMAFFNDPEGRPLAIMATATPDR